MRGLIVLLATAAVFTIAGIVGIGIANLLNANTGLAVWVGLVAGTLVAPLNRAIEKEILP